MIFLEDGYYMLLYLIIRKGASLYTSLVLMQKTPAVLLGVYLCLLGTSTIQNLVFCSSEAVSNAMKGTWDYEMWKSLMIDKTDEMGKLDNL